VTKWGTTAEMLTVPQRFYSLPHLTIWLGRALAGGCPVERYGLLIQTSNRFHRIIGSHKTPKDLIEFCYALHCFSHDGFR
jgi:hypothetical protein